eukprot:scaffold920_cov93-Cylindrotheca_fusiformis.AAC.2
MIPMLRRRPSNIIWTPEEGQASSQCRPSHSEYSNRVPTPSSQDSESPCPSPRQSPPGLISAASHPPCAACPVDGLRVLPADAAD